MSATDFCRWCGTTVIWTGVWWAHEQQPSDDHDAYAPLPDEEDLGYDD